MREKEQFSESEIEIAQEFYSNFMWSTREHNSHARKKKRKGTKRKKKQREFVLPDKMAIGFVLMLGGSLLCIIPSGITQGIGTGMIATGLYSVIEGAREGEKPYYIDSETGNPIDQSSDSTVGVGIEF